MSEVRGTLRNGRVEFDGPPPAWWRDGVEIRLTPLDGDDSDSELPQDGDPRSIERWVAWLDSLKEYRMSDEDYADFERVLRENKEASKAAFAARCRQIEEATP